MNDSESGDQNGRALAVFGTILAIGNAQGKVSHEFFRSPMKFRSYGELDLHSPAPMRAL